MCDTQPHESPSVEKIYPAFIAAQHEIEAVKKNAENTHIGTMYADLSAIIEAVRPILKNHGLGYTQKPQPSQSKEARLTTRIIHVSGEWFESTITVPATVFNKAGIEILNAQTYGAAMTYGRRYALAAMLGIATEDADGMHEAAEHDDDSDADLPETSAETNAEKLRAAKSMQELLNVMNALPTEKQKPVRKLFQELLNAFKEKKAPARKRAAK